MVNKLTIVNRSVLHTLHLEITHLAVIKCKAVMKLEKLKCGGEEW